VDPIKANEVPIPRGSASKRRRVSDEDSSSTTKRMKHESSFEDDFLNGDIHTRHSLPNQFSVESSLLQGIAFSAQQALARDEDELVPVDPALQAYAGGAYSTMDMPRSYATNGDNVMSSVEQQAEGDVAMDGIEFTTQNGGLHVPSVEPLTPGPPPHNNTVHAQTNGHPVVDIIHVKANGFTPRPSLNNAVRRPSSPVSPRHTSAVSPGTENYNTYMTSPITVNQNNYNNNFTTDSDFPPPPATPATNGHRLSRPPNSSGRKSAQTPSRRRASKTPKSTPGGRRHDSGEGIKLEAGLGMGMNMNMNMGINMNMSMLGMDMIDPSLDQASIDLIKQLQQEELGLRRRSR
jgi:F-box/leucine-rich repeat protein 10/11